MMPSKPIKYRVHKPVQHKTGRREYSLTQRAIGTALIEIDGNSVRQAAQKTGIPHNTLSRIRKRAVQHADENDLPLDDPSNYEDAPRAGRTPVLTVEEGDNVCSYVTASRENREKSATELINEMGLKISESTLKQVMYDRGYARNAHGWKTRLEPSHRAARKTFGIKYRNFDFRKRGIFTDEVSIKKAEHKFNKKTWRLRGEEYSSDVIEKKHPFDEFSDGMMWASFAYNIKGPIHFFFKETPEQKAEYQHLLDVENAEEHPRHWVAFEVIQMIKEAELASEGKRRRGPVPKFQNYLKKMIKSRGDRSKGGVDWLRHREEVLKPKLLPFAKQLQDEGRDPMVIEDGASSHDNQYNHDLFDQRRINKCMDWPARSPDINAIEKAWDWCRKYLADRRFVATSREHTIQMWTEAWEALPIDLINKWIDQTSDILEKIIIAEGDNSFHG